MCSRMRLVAVVLAAASILLTALGADEPRVPEQMRLAPGLIVANDQAQVAETREAWNRAVRAAQARQFDDLTPLLTPLERSRWLATSRSKLEDLVIALEFPGEANAGNSKVLIYQQPDGQALARIYSGAPRDYLGRQGLRRHLLATITGEARGTKLIHLDSEDRNRFGIGQPVAGIKLEARAAKERIATWKRFAIVLRFVNTTRTETIDISSGPSFFIQHGFTICISGAEPESSGAEFETWYRRAEESSSMPVGGLVWSLGASHKAISLNPGEAAEFEVHLANLCWGPDNIPDGPTGTFRLFVTYDPNLEWDPYEGIVAAWRHRVASTEFTATVGR